MLLCLAVLFAGLNDRWNALAGALYVFHRSASVSSGQQQLLAAVQWTPVEHLKIQVRVTVTCHNHHRSQ